MKKIFISFVLIANFLFSQTYNWQALNYPPSTTGRYDDVFFLNENLGWAARGGNGAVFKTTNGGATWTEQVVSSQTGQYFRNIEFLNENIGFLGTLNNNFYKTINGGATWAKVNNISPYPAAICGLDTVGASTVYGCGAWFSPAYVIKSTDSGNTWKYINMSAYATALVEILFIDENTGFASGSDEQGAVILKTTNGGDTWTKIYSAGEYGDYVWKLQIFPDNKTIFGSIESETQGKLLKTFDGGLTWQTKNFPDPYVQAVGFVSETHGWMGGHNSGFMETFDGGNTWINNSLGGSLNRIFFVNGTTAFASGNQIYKMTTTGLSTNESGNEKVENLKIKIVPNPITDKLNLNIHYIHSDHIIVGLYDLTGKFLGNILKDDVGQKGLKKYSLDFKYPAGEYLLAVQSNLGRQSIKIIKK
ncbi:T9SS type A sorting domain-containing protein [Epilithonimonas sp.]|uniref:T9SS type A sorting domain-containing protein n=1 Tax=Epilithonimonas sp. TaxID=2894511 RepID=UPI00289BADA9|nr:T9SS type A sorting domain-containing protein [Epilithonimonas sp.]